MYRRILLVAAFFAGFVFSAVAQHQHTERCGTMQHDSLRRRLNPDLGSLQDFERQLQQWLADQENSRVQGGVLTLPVVVHVIHEGSSVGNGLNISDAQVESQIKVLNEDFRRKAGTNGFNSDPDGADVEIEFQLVARAPDGSATNGIDRVNVFDEGLPAGPYTSGSFDADIKPATSWDPELYVNFWVADLDGGLIGYAQFPSASVPGISNGCNPTQANTDGVVMRTTSFGTIDEEPSPGDFNLSAPYNLGRTTTHEIGHWLALRHTWGDAFLGIGGCGVDDFCADTPNIPTSSSGCPSRTACDGTTPAMVENYMDYSDDACMNIFTKDQKARMRATLLNSPLRRTLINSIALVPPVANDASMASIENPVGVFCDGTTITPEVTFKNNGTSNLTSLTINYQLDGGAVVSTNWTGSIATGDTEQITLAPISPGFGAHTLTVYTTQPNGLADSETARDTLESNFSMEYGRTLPFEEDFESSVYPPEGWMINNPDEDCNVWTETYNIIGSNGTETTTAYMQLFDYTPADGQRDEYYTPPIDLYNAGAGTELAFDIAHAQQNTSNNDEFRVEISTDCGQSWQATPVFSKSGGTLATTSTLVSGDDWEPDDASDWRTETVNLDAYRGQQIKLRFVTVNDNGNNVYLDNIRVDAPILSCDITDLSAGAQTACDPATNTYTQEVTVTYQAVPRDGLIVNGQSFPVTSSPQTVTLTGLVSDGNPVDVTASASGSAGCTYTENNLFTAAANCQGVNVTLATTANSPTNQSPIPYTVTFSASVTGFTLGDISVTNGTTGNFVQVSGSEYTFDVTPTAAGTVSVQIPANVAQDTNGNDNDPSNTVDILFDDIAPTMVCQNATISINPVGVATLTSADVDGGSTDNIGIATLSLDETIFGCTEVGTSTVVLTATDEAGNSASCSADVTVVDDTDPTINCPGNQTVTVDANCDYTLPDYTGLAATDDNCSVATVTQSPAVGTTQTGAVTVTLTATDASGNTSTCTFQTVPDDTTLPSVACPADQTESLDANCQFTVPDYTSAATITDNCTVATVVQSPAAGTVLNGAGTNTITITATDGSGNSNSCSFDLILEDNTAPALTGCPSDQNVSLDNNCEFILPDYTTSVTATDNCGVTVTQAPASGTAITAATTVTITAEDAAGNTTACSFVLTPVDDTDPVISCPANQTVTVNATCGYTLPDYTGLATASDNCGTAMVTQSPAAGTTQTGAVTVTLTATDGSSNTASCTFQTVPDDATPPSLTCPADQTESLDANCQFTVPDYTGSATSTDNCGVVNLTQSPAAGTVLNGAGTTTITITSTDGSSNSSSCTFNLVVEDNTAPALTGCPSDQNVSLDNNCEFILPDYTTSVTATDNCGVTVTQAPASGTAITAATTVTITAEDAAGNTTACSFVLTPVDDTDPVISCPANQTVTVNATCGYTLPDYTGLATASDNCGTAMVTQSPAAGTTQTGAVTVTLTATDGSSNTASCTFQTVPDDATPPSLTCPADQTESLDANCQFTVPDYTGSATSTDNCGVVNLTQSPAAGTVLNGAGTTAITITSTDGSSNSSSCTFNLVVEDNTAPSVVCQPFTGQLTASGSLTIAPSDIDNGSTDNCGITALSLDQTVFTCADAGTNTVTLTATDGAGNSSSCTAVVTINLPPDPTIAGTTTLCAGENTTLTASGGLSYIWSNAATTAGITVAPTTTTTYSVTAVTAPGGCTGSASVTVTVNPLPAAPTISGAPTTTCAGDNLTLTASGGTNYTWSNGATGASINVAPTSTTVYTVTETDANGCEATSAAATVSVNPLPTITFSGTTTIVPGTTTTISATSSTAVSFNWNTGATGTSITVAPTTTTTYDLTVTDLNGCQTTQSITVFMAGSGAVPTAPNPPRDLIATGQNTYTIRLDWTDIANNEIRYDIYRAPVSARNLSKIAEIPAGTGEMVYIDSAGLDPDTRYSYQVIAVGSLLSGRSNVANGATYPNVPQLISVENGCIDGTARITVAGDQSSEQFFWYIDSAATSPILDFDGTNFDENTLEVARRTPGTYTFYVTAVGVKYESQPRLPVSVTFTDLPEARIETTSGRSCDETITLTAAEVAGATYTWTINGDVIGTGRTITGTQEGDYRVTVEKDGCSATSEALGVDLNYAPVVRLNVSDNVSFCEQGEIAVNEIPGAIYGWTKDGDNLGVNTSVLTVTESGEYQAIVTVDGCPAQSVAVDVTVDNPNPTQSIELNADATSLCPTERTTLSITPIAGATYQWFRDGNLIETTSDNTLETGIPGRYAVSAQLPGVCGNVISSAALTLEVFETPEARLKRDADNAETLIVEIPGTVTVQNIVWTFNGEEVPQFAGQQTITPTEEGTYLAFVTYTSGCTVFTNGFRFFNANEPDVPTGTEEEETGLALYPNPTNGAFVLRLPTSWTGETTLRLVDNLGKVLDTQVFAEDNKTLRLDISSYAAGTYFVQLETAEGLFVRKIVRQ